MYVTGGLNLIWEIREGFLLGKSRNELDKDEGKRIEHVCEKWALEDVKEGEYG